MDDKNDDEEKTTALCIPTTTSVPPLHSQDEDSNDMEIEKKMDLILSLFEGTDEEDRKATKLWRLLTLYALFSTLTEEDIEDEYGVRLDASFRSKPALIAYETFTVVIMDAGHSTSLI